MNPILQVDNLTKIYKKTKVVNQFHMSMEKGHIYGLIGPNGAGKTTIMKMIAGLAPMDAGSITLFGDTIHLDENRSRMSFMIESPYLDTSMTAHQNLEHYRYLRGVADKKRIQQVLDFVGLVDIDKKKVKQFSLGMKQRLGIAMALLPSPEIMILDEPVNGLDPEGIVDVRNLLRKLSTEQDIAILISSHLLSELSELCTDFMILNHGELIESLSAEELEQKCKNYIAIKTNDIAKTTTILEQKLNITDYHVIEHDEIHLYEMLDDIEKVSKTITDSGLILTKFVIMGENLEEYYLSTVSPSKELPGKNTDNKSNKKVEKILYSQKLKSKKGGNIMNKLIKAECYRITHSSGILKNSFIFCVLMGILPFISNPEIYKQTASDFGICISADIGFTIIMILSTLSSVIVASAFQNKTAYYEIMSGCKTSHILLSKLIVNTTFLVFVLMLLLGISFSICGLQNGIGNLPHLGIRITLLAVILMHGCIVGILIATTFRHYMGAVFTYLRICMVDGIGFLLIQLLDEICSISEHLTNISHWFMLTQIEILFSNEVKLTDNYIFAVIASCIIEGILWYVISYARMKKKNF